MRQLATFLLIALVLPVLAAETWRWKDENGVVHYSDRPLPGAERVEVAAPNLEKAATGSQAPSTPRPAQPAPAGFRYTECIVQAPGKDQVFNAVDAVTASVRISPALQRDHRVQVILDGNVYAAWPERALTGKLEAIQRGTHTLRVLVLDAGKKAVCEGPAISFHVRQPSVLAPNKQKPNKP